MMQKSLVQFGQWIRCEGDGTMAAIATPIDGRAFSHNDWVGGGPRGRLTVELEDGIRYEIRDSPLPRPPFNFFGS